MRYGILKVEWLVDHGLKLGIGNHRLFVRRLRSHVVVVGLGSLILAKERSSIVSERTLLLRRLHLAEWTWFDLFGASVQHFQNVLTLQTFDEVRSLPRRHFNQPSCSSLVWSLQLSGEGRERSSLRVLAHDLGRALLKTWYSTTLDQRGYLCHLDSCLRSTSATHLRAVSEGRR